MAPFLEKKSCGPKYGPIYSNKQISPYYLSHTISFCRTFKWKTMTDVAINDYMFNTEFVIVWWSFITISYLDRLSVCVLPKFGRSIIK